VKVGIPKEIKNNEYRVGMTPAGVEALVAAGHEVFVQKSAGEGTRIPDEDYVKAGAEILPAARDVFDAADMIVKVKEPLEPEFPLFHRGQILFTYLHLAGDRELTDRVLELGIVGIAYETMEREDGTLPLLVPMSEVAGRLATVEGAKYLQRTFGGRGIFLGSGDPPSFQDRAEQERQYRPVRRPADAGRPPVPGGTGDRLLDPAGRRREEKAPDVCPAALGLRVHGLL